MGWKHCLRKECLHPQTAHTAPQLLLLPWLNTWNRSNVSFKFSHSPVFPPLSWSDDNHWQYIHSLFSHHFRLFLYIVWKEETMLFVLLRSVRMRVTPLIHAFIASHFLSSSSLSYSSTLACITVLILQTKPVPYFLLSILLCIPFVMYHFVE